MDYRPDISTSSSCVDYFKEISAEFGTIKEISCVFDVVNFLFFEDSIENGNSNFVAKGFNGNRLFLNGMNCGYNGEGPRALETILIFLGVPEENAEKIKLHAAVKVYFLEDGKYDRCEYPEYFIDSRHRKNFIDTRYVRSNISKRKLYLINPERYMKPLFSLIDNLKPYRISYWIGEGSELEDTQQRIVSYDEDIDQSLGYEELIEKQKKYRRKHYMATDVNIILYGNEYELALLIPKKLQVSFLETILLYLKAYSFVEENKKELTEFYFPSFFKKWFKKDKGVRGCLNGSLELGEYDE